GSGTAPPAGAQTVQLVVDDGSYELGLGFQQGAPSAYFVNRLTPPIYPATLRAVVIAFGGSSNNLRAGDAMSVLSGANPGGGATINSIALARLASTVQAVGQFNAYEVAP